MDNYSFPQFEQSLAQRVSTVMKRVYFKMTLALLVTAFVSMWAAGSEMFFFQNTWQCLLSSELKYYW